MLEGGAEEITAAFKPPCDGSKIALRTLVFIKACIGEQLIYRIVHILRRSFIVKDYPVIALPWEHIEHWGYENGVGTGRGGRQMRIAYVHIDDALLRYLGKYPLRSLRRKDQYQQPRKVFHAEPFQVDAYSFVPFGMRPAGIRMVFDECGAESGHSHLDIRMLVLRKLVVDGKEPKLKTIAESSPVYIHRKEDIDGGGAQYPVKIAARAEPHRLYGP